MNSFATIQLAQKSTIFISLVCSQIITRFYKANKLEQGQRPRSLQPQLDTCPAIIIKHALCSFLAIHLLLSFSDLSTVTRNEPSLNSTSRSTPSFVQGNWTGRLQPMCQWHIRREEKSPPRSKLQLLRSHALYIYTSRFACSSDPAKGYDTFDEHNPSAVDDFKQRWQDFLERKGFGQSPSTTVDPYTHSCPNFRLSTRCGCHSQQ